MISAGLLVGRAAGGGSIGYAPSAPDDCRKAGDDCRAAIPRDLDKTSFDARVRECGQQQDDCIAPLREEDARRSNTQALLFFGALAAGGGALGYWLAPKKYKVPAAVAGGIGVPAVAMVGLIQMTKGMT